MWLKLHKNQKFGHKGVIYKNKDDIIVTNLLISCSELVIFRSAVNY